MTGSPNQGWAGSFDEGACPDCGVGIANRELSHSPGCPIAVSFDEAADADQRFFETHPNATEYHRALTMGDRDAVLRSLPAPLPQGFRLVGRVRVLRAGSGVRVRDYSGVHAVRENGWSA